MTKEIDVERVWELWQVKGSSVKDVAVSMGVTAAEVRQALQRRARTQRTVTKKELLEHRRQKDERAMFNKAFPYLKDAEGPAWEAWVARSKLKV